MSGPKSSRWRVLRIALPTRLPLLRVLRTALVAGGTRDVFVCEHTFWRLRWGKKEDQGTSTPPSVMSGSKIPKPTDISTDNIIKPSFDELSEEHRQAYEAYKKKRDEEDMDSCTKRGIVLSSMKHEARRQRIKKKDHEKKMLTTN